jgi:hypothetical protein
MRVSSITLLVRRNSVFPGCFEVSVMCDAYELGLMLAHETSATPKARHRLNWISFEFISYYYCFVGA